MTIKFSMHSYDGEFTTFLDEPISREELDKLSIEEKYIIGGMITDTGINAVETTRHLGKCQDGEVFHTYKNDDTCMFSIEYIEE